MSLTETELKLVAAGLGLVGTVVGLLLGAGIQAVTSKFSRRREKQALVAYANELVLNIKNILAEYLEPEKALPCVRMNIVFPKIVLDEIETLRDSARKVSPRLAIDSMWLSQACKNLETAIFDLSAEIKKRKEAGDDEIRLKHDKVLIVVSSALGVQKFCNLILAKNFLQDGITSNLRTLRHLGAHELFSSYKKRDVK